MKRILERLLLAVLVAPLVATMGCPDSDPIHGEVGSLVVEFVASPDGAGRYQEQATVSISGVAIRPIDPEAQQTLGNQPIGLLSRPIPVNLNSSSVQSSSSKRLSPGVYELQRVRLSQFTLVTSDPLPTGPTCIDQIAALTQASAGTAQALNAAVIIDFNPAVTVTVADGDVATLRIEVDAPGFVQLMESRYNCIEEVPPTPPVERCTARQDSPPAPCLQQFAVPTSDQFKTVFSFE